MSGELVYPDEPEGLPDPLLAKMAKGGLIAPKQPPPNKPPGSAFIAGDDGDDKRMKAYAAGAIAAELQAIGATNPETHNRNQTLYQAAANLRRFIRGSVLREDIVTYTLQSAAYATGLTEPEVTKSIHSGYHKDDESNTPLVLPKGYEVPEAFQMDTDALDEQLAGQGVGPVDAPMPLEAMEGDFWTRRPELELIFTASLAQMASPWAVLACCIARVLACVPPEVTLPAIIGGKGSLNWFAAISARSGGGKGAAMAVAEDLVRNEGLLVRDIGSGEGMIECYKRRAPNKGETMLEVQADWVTAVMFNVEEIDSIASMQGRSGQTTMSILRKGFSGERLGFSYRGREGEAVAKHTYRMTMVASVQPERAGALFDDAGGGTPQRFMWFPARDKRIRKNPPPWPTDEFGPKRVPLPGPGDLLSAAPGAVAVPQVVVDTIIDARVSSMNGDENALDGHALFCREKFAYALAVMNGRGYISEEDWELSGTAAHVSDWCRTKAQQGYQVGKERISTERGELRGIEDAARDTSKVSAQQQVLNRICALLVTYLQETPQTRGDMRRKLPSRDRPNIDKALQGLVDKGYIKVNAAGVWELNP